MKAQKHEILAIFPGTRLEKHFPESTYHISIRGKDGNDVLQFIVLEMKCIFYKFNLNIISGSFRRIVQISFSLFKEFLEFWFTWQ